MRMVLLAAFIVAFVDTLLVRLFFTKNSVWLTVIFLATFFVICFVLGGLFSVSRRAEEDAAAYLSSGPVKKP